MADTQRVNGFTTSWSDCSFKLGGDRYYGITEISYGDKRARSKVYGMGRAGTPRGRTRGKYEVDEVTWKMDFPAWVALRDALSALADDRASYGDVEFEGVMQYAYGANEETHTDELFQLVITGVTHSASEGPDAIMVDVTADCMGISRDGKTLYNSAEAPR
jgi:hypothetical protein